MTEGWRGPPKGSGLWFQNPELKWPFTYLRIKVIVILIAGAILAPVASHQNPDRYTVPGIPHFFSYPGLTMKAI